MNAEKSSSSQDSEQQLNQALERWIQDYELDDDDLKILHEEFWADDVESPEGAATVLQDLEELLRERHQNVRQYRAEMATFVSQFHQLDASIEEQLKQKRMELQTQYHLSEKHTDPGPIVKRHRKSLDRYTKAVHDLAQKKQSLLFNEDDRAYLDRERQTLEPAVAQRIEQDLLKQKRQEYRQVLSDNLLKFGSDPRFIQALPELQKQLLPKYWLDESLVQDIHVSFQSPEPPPKTPIVDRPQPPVLTIPWKLVLGGLTSVGVVAGVILTSPFFQPFSPLLEVAIARLNQMANKVQLMKDDLLPKPWKASLTLSSSGKIQLVKRVAPDPRNPTRVEQSTPLEPTHQTPPEPTHQTPSEPTHQTPPEPNPQTPPERSLPPVCDYQDSRCPPAHTP